VEVVCPERPQGNVDLNLLTGKKLFQIKKGSLYHLRIYFIVRFDIVNGLKLIKNTYK
jgi:hypothetical protein